MQQLVSPVVHDTVRDFYSKNGINPGCDLALAAEEMIHNTRTALSNLFNPSLVQEGKTKDPNRLVFTLNATMSLNLIINGTVGPGDHVVTTKVEHNSVIRPVTTRSSRDPRPRSLDPTRRDTSTPRTFGRLSGRTPSSSS